MFCDLRVRLQTMGFQSFKPSGLASGGAQGVGKSLQDCMLSTELEIWLWQSSVWNARSSWESQDWLFASFMGVDTWMPAKHSRLRWHRPLRSETVTSLHVLPPPQAPFADASQEGSKDGSCPCKDNTGLIQGLVGMSTETPPKEASTHPLPFGWRRPSRCLQPWEADLKRELTNLP